MQHPADGRRLTLLALSCAKRIVQCFRMLSTMQASSKARYGSNRKQDLCSGWRSTTTLDTARHIYKQNRLGLVLRLQVNARSTPLTSHLSGASDPTRHPSSATSRGQLQ